MRFAIPFHQPFHPIRYYGLVDAVENGNIGFRVLHRHPIYRIAVSIIIIWVNNFYRGENHASTLLFFKFFISISDKYNKEGVDAGKMEKGERETEPRFGLANFEGRRHPRFSIDLPVEYWPISSSRTRPGRMMDISEGGLLLHLSEPLEIGQNLGLNLFIDSGPDLDSIEALVQVEVVWRDIQLEKEGDCRIGVKFVDISPEDMEKLRGFLNTLMNFKNPSELKIPSRLASTLTTFSAPHPSAKK